MKSCGYVWLLGHSSPQYQANSLPIVTLALEDKASQPNICLSVFTSYGFIESKEVYQLVAGGVT